MCFGPDIPDPPKPPSPPTPPPPPTKPAASLSIKKKKTGRRPSQGTASLRIPMGVAKPSSGSGLSIPKSPY